MGFELKTTEFYKQKIRNILTDLASGIRTSDDAVFADIFINSISENFNNISTTGIGLAMIQSVTSAEGSNLDDLGNEYGITRKAGAAARGIILLTKTSLDTLAIVNINSGDYLITNDKTYSVLGNYSMVGINKTAYSNVTGRYRSALTINDITDTYGILVNVECSEIGTDGNVISNTVFASNGVQGIDHAVNPSAITGGRDEENDIDYRKRILLAILGNIVGTENNYKRTALENNFITDAMVIGPNDDLMVRDGRREDSEGNVIDEGTGGKIDIYVEGTDPTGYRETYTYTDQSGNDDPTDLVNDFILGQSLLQDEKYYKQPAISIGSVAGSLTGANYVNGVHYELKQDIQQTDPTDEAGSYKGKDALHWLTGSIGIEGEPATKGVINSKDKLTYQQILDVSKVQGSIILTNENSTKKSSFTVETIHKPITAVTRVYNRTTGETYTVVSFDEDTGVVTYTGTLAPVSIDILEVDYTWGITYSNLIDYSLSEDTIDWSHNKEAQEVLTLLNSQTVAPEEAISVENENSSGNGLVVTTKNEHISSVQSFVAYDLSVLDKYPGGEPVQTNESTNVNLTYKKINNRGNRFYTPDELQQVEFANQDLGNSQTSLSFTDKETFLNEVKTSEELGQVGDYYTDYENGIVTTYVIPGYRRQIGCITESLQADPPKVKTVVITLNEGINEIEFSDLLLNVS